MNPRDLISMAPALLRPVLHALLDRLDSMEARIAAMEARANS